MHSRLFLPLTILFLICLSFSNGTKILALKDAINQKKVTSKIVGYSGSPHYSQPAKIQVTNNTNEKIALKIVNGQKLVSDPEGVQDLIVVKNEMIVLAAKETKEVILHAMCIQHNNSGPNKSTSYELGAIAEGPMKSLTKEIQKRSDYNTLGQYSIWTISDDEDLSTIAGYDEATVDHYQKFVSNLTGKPIPKKDTVDYLTNYNKPTLMKRTVGGSFDYGLVKESSVTIGMFDKDDIIVRELLNESNVAKGDHDFDFEFDATAFNDDVYYIRLIIDGRIKLGYTMEMMN
jgi:hypothetical protein